MNRSRMAAVLMLVVAGGLSGCASLDVPWFNRVPEATARNPVVKVMCLWEPSEGRDPNGIPCRGFAGQILFLGNKGGLPVKVDGAVTVYVFDDLGTLQQQATPIHEFKFDPVSWNRHLKVGTFGPAYHVFVPYTRPGAFESNCTLRIKFAQQDIGIVYSDACSIKLTGKPREPQPDDVIPTGESVPAPKRQVQSTTIPLDGGRTESDLTPADADRTNRLLQEFLQKQLREQHSRETPQAASPRFRFDGNRVEVVSEPPTTQTVDRDGFSLDEQTTAVN